MNVVLYTTDLEPITILDLPVWLLEQLERQGAVRIAVLKPPRWSSDNESTTFDMPETVTVYCEKLRWRDNTTKIILVTPDEELALTLKPEWLPGQRAAVQSYKAYIRHLTEQLVKAMRKD
jgi:hypothetical protein